jgi:proteic killer suppression protein
MDVPFLKLHELKGDKKGVWSVTVQANWRITFRYYEGDAKIVCYEDYH